MRIKVLRLAGLSAVFLISLVLNSPALPTSLRLSVATQPALAAGGDFKNTDFVAAAPYTYNHDTGGGAYDDRTVGDTNDIVEQLEGVQFACDDIVTFLAAIEIVDSPVDPVQAAEFDFRFLADSTGQSGTAIADILGVAINYGVVQAGDGPGGTDAGMQDDGGSTATLISETLTGPLFTAGSELLGTVQVTDLEAGEKVVLRIDTQLACQPNTRPTGNLQAQLDAGRVVGSGDAISTGQQTIPFLRVDDIAGAGDPWLKIQKRVTTQSGTCQLDDVEELSVTFSTEPVTVKYCFTLINPGTADLFDVTLVDNNGTPTDASDDFSVSLTGLADLDGEADLGDLASGGTAVGEALVTFNGPDTVINTATGNGHNGASGSNYTVLTQIDTAMVYVVDIISQLTWETESSFVAFEDLKNVARSDWDYNDLVVDIQVDKGLTPGGDLAALKLHYDSMARGASLEHTFIHDMPLAGGGQANLIVTDPTGSVIKETGSIFTDTASFTIYDSTKAALPPETELVNTIPGQSLTEGYTATLTIYLNEPVAPGSLPPLPWNPYIFVHGTNQEVHLTIPGHLDNMQMVNAELDPGSPLIGFSLPLAHVFDPGWKWPIEAVGLWRGYPQYADYIYSGQTSPADWYYPENAQNEWLWSPGPSIGSLVLDVQDEDTAPPSRYFAGPHVTDLNGDGQSEIIMANMLQNQVEIYNAGRQLQAGWPQAVGGNLIAAATTANLDNDADLEILVGAGDGKLYAWHHTGEAVAGWPVELGLGNFRVLATPAVAHLDGDAVLDIVVPLADGKLYAVSANGAIKPGWPVSLGGVEDLFDSQIINSSPRIADLNSDGSPEIIVGSTDKQLYVFNSNGSVKWKFQTGDMVLSSPAVADFDPARSGLEIAIGSGDSYVYLLDQDGNLIWKNSTGWIIQSSPIGADLDSNGDLEILIGSDDDKVWVWHHDGQLMAGWPQATQANIFPSPAVGDIDGNGSAEVVVGSDDAHVYAWYTYGAAAAGWPRETGLPVKGTPVLANLDADPALEVIVGDFGGTLYVWNYSADDQNNQNGPHKVFLPLIMR